MYDDEFDIQQFAKLFDAALASDNPSVKKALRNFMMVASIAEAEHTATSPRPLSQVLEKVDILEGRLQAVEKELMNGHYARQKAKEMARDYSWDQYTTTWPGTTTKAVDYTSNKVLDYDIDYISRLLNNKGTP